MSLSDLSNNSIQDWKEEYTGGVVDDDNIIRSCAEALVMLSTTQPVKKEHVTQAQEEIVRYCQICNKSKTPLWRRTNDYHTLCNACGIRERMHNKNKSKTNLTMFGYL